MKPENIRLLAAIILVVTLLAPIYAFMCIYCAAAIALGFARDLVRSML